MAGLNVRMCTVFVGHLHGGVEGGLCRWEKEIIALGPTSADRLILIHQVKQCYVNRRDVT